MASKNELKRTDTKYEFALSHTNVITLMNDANVQLSGSPVSNSQILQLVLKRAGGSEIVLREMTPTDTLAFRFTKTTIEESGQSYTNIDVS